MIKPRFDEKFGHWDIRLPADDVAGRVRGKIVSGGWAIWYCFGKDERGEYLVYYAAHRMTNDRHVRIYEDGTTEGLPELISMRLCSKDPEEDARLEEEHRRENHEVEEMLEKKGFGVTGDEPGGVQINRFLTLNKVDLSPMKRRRRT